MLNNSKKEVQSPQCNRLLFLIPSCGLFISMPVTCFYCHEFCFLFYSQGHRGIYCMQDNKTGRSFFLLFFFILILFHSFLPIVILDLGKGFVIF